MVCKIFHGRTTVPDLTNPPSWNPRSATAGCTSQVSWVQFQATAAWPFHLPLFSPQKKNTILSTHFVMKMAKFDLYSNTNSPRAWIPPPIPAHAEAERPEEKGEGQVCRRAWTRYGRTNQRVVSVAGQKDLSTRVWWVMHAATISSMYYNSVNNSGKHCSEPLSLVPRHQIFACALWPCWKMGSGHFSLLNWGVILQGVSACCRTNQIK